MIIVIGITAALFGIVVGSFLNVCIDRLPEKQSLLRPPSYCPSCQRRLAFRDLVPVFTYLWLRGRCRYCGSHIPQRILWVELGTGFIFVLLRPLGLGMSHSQAITPLCTRQDNLQKVSGM